LESLSKKIKETRKKKKLTLERLAKAVGSSKSYMWQVENAHKNNPSFDIVVKIAKVFGVPLDYFANPHDTQLSTDDKNNYFLSRFNELDDDSKELIENLIEHLIKINKKNIDQR